MRSPCRGQRHCGIPEIVIDGHTGYLVAFEASGDAFGSPRDPSGFARDIAARVNDLLQNPVKARLYGRAGRQRVLGTSSAGTTSQT